MTNIDPGGLLVALTVIPAVIAGTVSVGTAHLVARLGYGTYERAVLAVLAVLVVGWVGAALVVSTSMLHILAVTLSMVGAFAVTQSVRSASYGWVLGVVLFFVAFLGMDWLGLYQGVDGSGRARGIVARHLFAFYYGGLFLFGAVGGKIVEEGRKRWRRRFSDDGQGIIDMPPEP
jgi:hypothetical protein